LAWSYRKDRAKTIQALRKAWDALENILPEFLGVIILVGIGLTLLNPQEISNLIGESSGWQGTIIAALVGSITLIPGVIAFPMAALLLQNGAGYMQIGAFISTLMMVGVVTLPVEIRYFGRKAAVMRNLLAFFFSFLVALIIVKVVGN
jgi:uncharacterized membrane protein YraQ (UPF0718 family)